ncbi:ketose-bisphosphate aldolase [Oribacterium sinus]
MPLVKMSKLLENARKENRACASLSVYSMESLMGVMAAVEELKIPVILQLAEARFGTAPLELMGPMMLSAAKNSSIDIAVHLDHGLTFETIEKALQMGFTSVMYDGSLLPIEENIANTKKVIEMAKNYDADVEAELGLVGKGEGGGVDHGVAYTKKEDALRFCQETGVTALAIAIGNKHGNYDGEPKLRFDILEEIHQALPEQFLVLHGGSGISDEDFQRASHLGIQKINIATALATAVVKACKEYCEENPNGDFYKMSKRAVEEVEKTAQHHILVFAGKE